MYQNLALLAAFLLTYSIFAGRFESRLLNGPLMFMLAGLILGPAFLGILQPRIDSHGLRILAELTLAIVLFSDAANADLKVLKAHEGLPLRLLLIGLPLTMLSGWLLGIWLFPQAPLIELALLAILLAPTDAALGKAVVSNPKVAAPVREGLNVESGLNDGICVPVLLMFLALLIEEHTQSPPLAGDRAFFRGAWYRRAHRRHPDFHGLADAALLWKTSLADTDVVAADSARVGGALLCHRPNTGW